MMHRLHRAVYWLLVGYVSLIVVGAMTVAVVWKLQHVRLLSVQTGSMVPAFHRGDAVLVQRGRQPRAGQVISYISPADPSVTVSHRVIRVDTQRGLIATKGDAATRADIPFSPELVLGRVTTVLPHLGYLLDFLHSRLGLITGVYLPAAAVVVSEVRRLSRHFALRPYRLLRSTVHEQP